jgi:glycine/D-amino acid oxidase-like deaminating enzyme
MTAERTAYDAVVIGGGFFGGALAAHLAGERGLRVVVFERGDDLLGRASYANQARVHQGYHYPRSILTALRCRVNFPRFVSDYRPAIIDDFEKVYAVGRTFSKVTAAQFRAFCERIGAPIRPAPAATKKLFDPDRIEDVFLTREVAFDALRLRALVRERLDDLGVEVRNGTEAESVHALADGRLETVLRGRDGARTTAEGTRVFNCTYARMNGLLARSGLPTLRLKHELTEMPLVELPHALRNVAVTVMCGPYFSLMPFPARGLHTLSHVRYTPHGEWHDGVDPAAWRDPYAVLADAPRISNFPHMVRDAARYLPAVAGARRVDSLWEVKTVLPKSEVDDSRPVLYVKDCGLPNLTCLLGGKIDNVYDILDVLAAEGGLEAA